MGVAERQTRVRTFPVMEIFGATIQGEGALAGLPTHFVRFGGCDYRCSWCDSMHAVDPALVRAGARKLSAEAIAVELDLLGGAPEWVTISGGNPALHDLSELLDLLHGRGLKVAVETQGSRWKDWLADVDCLTVSPKPPSSGMVTAPHDVETRAFMEQATISTEHRSDRRALKIVVFDRKDYDWAREFILNWWSWPAFLSVGTDRPPEGTAHLWALGMPATLRGISDRYRWLCETVAADPDLSGVRVFPQLHVLAWGHKQGV